MTEEVNSQPTGKVRTNHSVYDFKYRIEEEYSDGVWRVNDSFPVFGTIEDAKRHFERAKKVAREIPADLGSWNE